MTHLAVESVNGIVGSPDDGLDPELGQPFGHQERLDGRDERVELRGDEKRRGVGSRRQVERREGRPVRRRIGRPGGEETVKQGVGDEGLGGERGGEARVPGQDDQPARRELGDKRGAWSRYMSPSPLLGPLFILVFRGSRTEQEGTHRRHPHAPRARSLALVVGARQAEALLDLPEQGPLAVREAEVDGRPRGRPGDDEVKEAVEEQDRLGRGRGGVGLVGWRGREGWRTRGGPSGQVSGGLEKVARKEEGGGAIDATQRGGWVGRGNGDEGMGPTSMAAR